MKQTSFLISFLLFSFHAFFAQQEGFVAGTLVKTLQGYTPIENVQIGDTVTGYDHKNTTVVSTAKHYLPSSIKLCIADHVCYAAPHQKFHCTSDNQWVSACQIKSGDFLSTRDSNCLVTHVEHMQQPLWVYTITVENHAFYITSADLLVHNMDLVCVGGAVTTFMTAGAVANPVGAAVVGGAMAIVGTGAFIYKVWKTWFGKSQQAEPIQAEINTSSDNQAENPQMPAACPPQSSGGSSNVPPEDPEKDKDKKNVIKKEDIKISDDDAKHIFRKKEGHFPNDTPENRELLLELVSDIKNFLGPDKHGNCWYGKMLPSGKQLWGVLRGNFLRYGGLNEKPILFNQETGLCRPLAQKIGKIWKS